MRKELWFAIMIVGTGIIGNEFIKPARAARKEKVQRDAACEECVKYMDSLMDRVCVLQGKLALLSGSFYRILRSCAADDTPTITKLETAQLMQLKQSLELLEKQIESIDRLITQEESIQKTIKSI